MARILGITGNIACGKTTVGQILLSLGAERYIDADALVHRLYAPAQPITLQVQAAFGPSMLSSDGAVDRKVLGALVFHDAAALQRLEQIVHPAVSLALQQELSQVSSAGIAVVDAVKLLEGGSVQLCASKWLVLCPEDHELARLMSRNALSYADALARIRAQPDRQTALSLVDEVIHNDTSLDALRSQVSLAFARFCTKFRTH